MLFARSARRWLFALARTAFFGALLRKVFAHMSFVIPLERLRETPALVAFQHPSPSYPVHVLIVPKRDYRSMLDLPAGDTQFLHDLVETVAGIVRELRLEERGYRLITNGGAYQDVPVLHFHLIAEGQ